MTDKMKIMYETASIEVKEMTPVTLLCASRYEPAPIRISSEHVVVEEFSAGFSDADGNDFKELNFD